MEWRVPLADLDFDQEEEQAVLSVPAQPLADHKFGHTAVRRRVANATGVKHALALSNATEALHLACLALGIGPGDEVIVPSLTFVATANASYTRRRSALRRHPWPDELNISPAAIRRIWLIKPLS
jgi:dTDP-4-amino-4,6-dideoxygalactose transaminase